MPTQIRIEPNGFGDGADVVVETITDAVGNVTHEVRRRKPMPLITLSATKSRFAADGVDYAEVLTRVLDPWETELQGTEVYLPIEGTVTFEVNFNTTEEPLSGGAVRFRLSTTISGQYAITATLPSYGIATCQVEAVSV